MANFGGGGLKEYSRGGGGTRDGGERKQSASIAGLLDLKGAAGMRVSVVYWAE